MWHQAVGRPGRHLCKRATESVSFDQENSREIHRDLSTERDIDTTKDRSNISKDGLDVMGLPWTASIDTMSASPMPEEATCQAART